MKNFIKHRLREELLKENNNFKITKDFVIPNIIQLVKDKGFNVKLVGSIAKKGFSFKDVDILLYLDSENTFNNFENFLVHNGWEYRFSDENEKWGIFHNYEKNFKNNLIGLDVFTEEL